MNRRHRRSRWLIAALMALFWGSLGVFYEDVLAEPSASGPPATLQLVANHDVMLYRSGFIGLFDLVVTTDQPFQAWNLTVSWDSDAIVSAEAHPHPEFDDDGQLFADTRLNADSLSNIVDLRHGGGAPSGTVRVARLGFVSGTTEPVKMRVVGEVVAPDGTPFSVVVSEFTTFAP